MPPAIILYAASLSIADKNINHVYSLTEIRGSTNISFTMFFSQGELF